ncbi:TetR/AcrR family transcriptional regulator [Amycolatopsis regifaucium]|uniref:TetR family transcriptional regulator n=1 Tax=Amycolatopsis regifaucium TaxID=546365 RepID=A0A154MXR6_9PSEU|nr:TetR/AcrR family transcriptional regulator [Amycolatopsis regifaucium]KZB88547.1 TetR family transcriptional regulator [Amycolatopsis regifaucium]OKA07281.1 TetR family transcriptional regulator [Amycolatopsis regifaucium]SFI50654.1 DNA-binding transcriptional regulator, AcrR family [Amycolatopsis regifaucium]
MNEDKIDALPPGTALAWGQAPAPRRGPKPGYSLEQIVDAAIAQADAEGFAALTMPSIAKRLGVTANALYRYLSSKEELLVLVAEAAWGPPPEPPSGDWRAAVTAWAHALLERCRRHPWLIELPVRSAPTTPNLLGWLENFLDGMADSGLSTGDVVGCALLVDGWVRSTAALLRDVHASTPERVQAVSEFLRPRLEERGYSRVAAVVSGEAYGEDGVEDDDVEFGLGRILDGIEALIGRR